MSGKTVRVRIAVAVDRKGRYFAVGSKPKFEAEQRHEEEARDGLDQFHVDENYRRGGKPKAHVVAIHWVEAEVPLPVETTVEGEVRG